MKILNAEQMRQADAHAIDVLKIPSMSLMENAATQVTRILVQRNAQPRIVLVLCGKGNNGGDGLAVARLLRQHGWTSTAVLMNPASALSGDPAENWQRAIHAGVRCLENITSADLPQYLSEAEIVVDALFGTGLTKPLEGNYAGIVELINTSGKEIVSIDVPSGVSSDSGDVPGRAVQATVTVALAALKYCHIFPPAMDHCGDVFVVDIGIPTASGLTVLRPKDIAQLLPYRKSDSHKGTYGHAVVIAGSTGKSGAAYLCGKAALRSGAGLVTIAAPFHVQQIVAGIGPELMTLAAEGNQDYFDIDAAAQIIDFAKDKSAIALGPGIGTDEETLTFVQQILSRVEVPLILDADALNLIARDKSILLKRKPGSTILTPHPGEMSRMMQTETKIVQSDRIGTAKRLAAETRAVVALKGYRTVIADPEGNVGVNPTGGQALASGGTGDVLTGVIAGYLAQKLPPLQAAQAGIFIHGFVANLFEREFPQQALNALDILDYWNQAVKLVQTETDLEGEYLKLHFAF